MAQKRHNQNESCYERLALLAFAKSKICSTFEISASAWCKLCVSALAHPQRQRFRNDNHRAIPASWSGLARFGPRKSIHRYQTARQRAQTRSKAQRSFLATSEDIAQMCFRAFGAFSQLPNRL